MNSLAAGTTAQDTFKLKVIDDQGASATTTATFTITGVNDAPTLAGAGGTFTYTENGAAVVGAPTMTVTDVDSANLTRATVSIVGFLAGDTLAATTAGTNITASYSSGNGVLTLTGTDTKAHYQQVLDSVAYSSTSDNPTNFGASTSRFLDWQANDGCRARPSSS